MLNNDARQIFRRMQQSRGCGCHLHAIGIAIANPSWSTQPTDADADAICPSLRRFIRLLLQIYELCLAQFLYKRSWALACTHRNPANPSHMAKKIRGYNKPAGAFLLGLYICILIFSKATGRRTHAHVRR